MVRTVAERGWTERTVARRARNKNASTLSNSAVRYRSAWGCLVPNVTSK